MRLAQSTNRYLDAKAPWQAVKTDRADAARTIWTSLTAINCLKVALYPYMPTSSEKLHAMLGLDGAVETRGWNWELDDLNPGSPLPRPKPLFRKFDESLIDEETARLGS